MPIWHTGNFLVKKRQVTCTFRANIFGKRPNSKSPHGEGGLNSTSPTLDCKAVHMQIRSTLIKKILANFDRNEFDKLRSNFDHRSLIKPDKLKHLSRFNESSSNGRERSPSARLVMSTSCRSIHSMRSFLGISIQPKAGIQDLQISYNEVHWMERILRPEILLEPLGSTQSIGLSSLNVAHPMRPISQRVSIRTWESQVGLVRLERSEQKWKFIEKFHFALMQWVPTA